MASSSSHAALARTQERIQRIVDECGQSLPGGYESIPIPDSDHSDGCDVAFWS